MSRPKLFRRGLLLLFALFSAIGPGLMSQTDDEVAAFEKLMMQGLQRHQGQYFATMAPTYEDCQAVFKADGARLVYEFSKSMFGEISRDPAAMAEQFVDFRIAHFRSEDALIDRSSATGGMRGIHDYLLPNVTFHQVTFLRTEGAEFGVTYRYFVKVGDHWVFFPKPWRAFEDAH